MRKRKFFSHHHTSESLYLIPTFNLSLAKQSECSRFFILFEILFPAFCKSKFLHIFGRFKHSVRKVKTFHFCHEVCHKLFPLLAAHRIFCSWQHSVLAKHTFLLTATPSMADIRPIYSVALFLSLALRSYRAAMNTFQPFSLPFRTEQPTTKPIVLMPEPTSSFQIPVLVILFYQPIRLLVTDPAGRLFPSKLYSCDLF